MDLKEFEDVIYTEEEMYEKLKFWQRILKLDAWKVKLYICGEEDMPLENVQGCCEVCEPIRSAGIYIHNGKPSFTPWGFNMEQILIHELLHVKMNFFAPKQSKHKEKYLVYEQEVDSLATILYNLYKKDENDGNKVERTNDTTGKRGKRTKE